MIRTASALLLFVGCAPSAASDEAGEPERTKVQDTVLDPASALPEPIPVECGRLAPELVQRTGIIVRAVSNSEQLTDPNRASETLRAFVAWFDALDTSKVPFLPLMATKTDVRDKLLELADTVASPTGVAEWRQKSGNRVRIALQFYLSQTGCGGRR